jgi:hypothetical protein
MVRHVYVAATFEANGDRTVKGYRGASPLGLLLVGIVLLGLLFLVAPWF